MEGLLSTEPTLSSLLLCNISQSALYRFSMWKSHSSALGLKLDLSICDKTLFSFSELFRLQDKLKFNAVLDYSSLNFNQTNNKTN